MGNGRARCSGDGLSIPELLHRNSEFYTQGFVDILLPLAACRSPGSADGERERHLVIWRVVSVSSQDGEDASVVLQLLGISIHFWYQRPLALGSRVLGQAPIPFAREPLYRAIPHFGGPAAAEAQHDYRKWAFHLPSRCAFGRPSRYTHDFLYMCPPKPPFGHARSPPEPTPRPPIEVLIVLFHCTEFSNPENPLGGEQTEENKKSRMTCCGVSCLYNKVAK